MKHTYHRTLFYEDLAEAKVVLYFSDTDKYANGSRIYGNCCDEDRKIEFTGLQSYTIVEGGKEAEAVETIMDEVDENHEYLILNFKDHNEFYRNSHVVMFIH